MESKGSTYPIGSGPKAAQINHCECESINVLRWLNECHDLTWWRAHVFDIDNAMHNNCYEEYDYYCSKKKSRRLNEMRTRRKKRRQEEKGNRGLR